MRESMLIALVAVALLSGCVATGPASTATPPPHECMSAKPEICDMQLELHMLRFAQADQNAAIDEAEQRRKARSQTITESRDPATMERLQHRVPL